MVKLIERAGERLLGRFVPSVQASASCSPGWFGCYWCYGNCYRRAYLAYDCSVSYDHCCAGC